MTGKGMSQIATRFVVAAALFLATGAGAAPAAAQATDPVQTQTTDPAVPTETVEPVSPAAEESGWLDLGTWGIVVLIVIAALVAWFAFFRPRTRPDQRRRR